MQLTKTFLFSKIAKGSLPKYLNPPKGKAEEKQRPDRGSTDNESRSVSAAIGRGVTKLDAVLHKWVRSTSYELGFVVVRGSFFLLLLLGRWSDRKAWLKTPYFMHLRI